MFVSFEGLVLGVVSRVPVLAVWSVSWASAAAAALAVERIGGWIQHSAEWRGVMYLPRLVLNYSVPSWFWADVVGSVGQLTPHTSQWRMQVNVWVGRWSRRTVSGLSARCFRIAGPWALQFSSLRESGAG